MKTRVTTYRTFDGWKSHLRIVRSGEKASGRTNNGLPLFSREQTVKDQNHNSVIPCSDDCFDAMDGPENNDGEY